MLRKQHGGNGALHTPESPPERSGGFPEGEHRGNGALHTPESPPERQRVFFWVVFRGMFWTPGMVPEVALYNLT